MCGYYSRAATIRGAASIRINMVYRIAGNFGEVFNLAIWRILKKIAKLKLTNINNCISMT